MCLALLLFNLRPISKEEILLRSILHYAETLQGYELKPSFDPRACKVFEPTVSLGDDLGTYLYSVCRSETEQGTLYQDMGYDRSGRVVDGDQGFEAGMN
jgi:hypothetical protein